MGWGHLLLGLHSLGLGQRGVDAQGLEGTRESWGRRGLGPARRPLSPSMGKRRGPSGHTDLRHHVGDITGVGGQQDGVGIFGKLGEGVHVLLCHRERGGGAAMLGREGRGSVASHVPPKAHPCPFPSPPQLAAAPETAKLLTRCC